MDLGFCSVYDYLALLLSSPHVSRASSELKMFILKRCLYESLSEEINTFLPDIGHVSEPVYLSARGTHR